MNILQEKSYKFALRIVKLSEYLTKEKKEFVLSRKILDSGSNIGLLVEEGKQGKIDQTLFKNTLSQTKKHSSLIFRYGYCAIQNSLQNHKRNLCSMIVANCRPFDHFDKNRPKK